MSALEELKNLLDGSQGESIDVPHPNKFKNTLMTPLTDWHRSEMPGDFELNNLGGPLIIEDRESADWGKPLTYVKGQVASVVVLDAYGEQVGETQYVVLHKVTNPKVTNKDTSSSMIGAFTARDLARRFPSAFAQFEDHLRANGSPLPIALLHEVPPHVITMLTVKGVKTVESFASFTEKQMNDLKASLKASKMDARVPYVEKYRDQARTKVGYVEPEAARSKKVAA